MANFKRRMLLLGSGKQVKLFGNSLAINAGLEIGKGAAPNIFSFIEQQQPQPAQDIPGEQQSSKPNPARKVTAAVSNPHRLTRQELEEVADLNIRLWLDFKEKIREHGIDDVKIFNREVLR
jgi:hypothetical protein